MLLNILLVIVTLMVWVYNKITSAFHYQKLAAEQGDRDALCEVAHFYQWGLGVESDEKKAFEYYQRAVEAGSGQPCLKLASCYIEEIGVEKNMKAAFELYLTAAKEYHLSKHSFLSPMFSIRIWSRDG